MACSLRDAIFAIDGPQGGGWRARQSVAAGFWPLLSGGPDISIRDMACRFDPVGKALRVLAQGSPDVWKSIDRAKVVAQLRDRIRDPAIMKQNPTELCGPFAVLFELARRSPVRYVKGAAELLSKGKLTGPNGEVIEAEGDLRERPVPSGAIGDLDWMLAATMRNDENAMLDVTDGQAVSCPANSTL